MAKERSKEARELGAEELMRMNSQMGLPPVRYGRTDSTQSSMIKGRWSMYGEGQGLSMHCGEFEELSDVSHSLELPAGLSLTFLMDGHVSFALGGRQHTIGAKEWPVECACFSLAKPDVLTRHMQKGQRVRKLNIFVERRWLDPRLQSLVSCEQIEQIFHQHGILRSWRPSTAALALCQKVLAMGPVHSVSQRLKLESHLLEMVAEVIEDWAKLCQQNPSVVRTSAMTNLAGAVKSHIDSQQGSELSLQELAEIHHMSVSTLQRRFKASYGTTVKEYMRRKQLERARVAMVCEGLSIGEAAYLAGYTHVENFIAAFGKAYAMSPSQYRALHQAH